MLEILSFIELSCTDINRIASKVTAINHLTHQQKVEIVSELHKTNPNCKVEIVIK